MHRRYVAKRTMRTWNNNFVSGIIVTDKISPMILWYRLLKQAQITLNMLSPSKHNPNISAHAMMEGKFYFNKTPLTGACTKFIVHEKPTKFKHEDRTWCKAGT